MLLIWNYEISHYLLITRSVYFVCWLVWHNWCRCVFIFTATEPGIYGFNFLCLSHQQTLALWKHFCLQTVHRIMQQQHLFSGQYSRTTCISHYSSGDNHNYEKCASFAPSSSSQIIISTAFLLPNYHCQSTKGDQTSESKIHKLTIDMIFNVSDCNIHFNGIKL